MVEENKEQIGFHKGALATLAKEREGLVNMVKVVDSLMKAHIDELKKLGIDLEKEAKKIQEKAKSKLDERIA